MPVKERIRSLSGTFEELEQAAFPKHPFTLVQLRNYAYALQAGQVVSPEDARHVSSCDHCSEQLMRLHRTDPLLNGESKKDLEIVIHAAKDSAAEARIAAAAQHRLQQAAASAEPAALAAAAFVSQILKR